MTLNTWNVAVLVVGYLVSLGVGHLIVNRIITRVWKRHLPFVEEHESLQALVGTMDRFLFTSASLLGAKEFIAAWLIIKLAGQWKPSERDVDRPLYYIFLLGNGLNVIIGVGIALLIQALVHP